MLPAAHIYSPSTAAAAAIAPAAADPAELVRSALDQPTGTPPLLELARCAASVALIVDDGTRATPAHLLLPPLLEYLQRAGLRADQVTIVVALGSHQPMSQRALQRKLGKAVLRRYRVVNQDARDLAGFNYLGVSAAGIPAWISQPVVQADLRIGVGMVTPHLDAGFSGGLKIILPGVSAMPSVDAFHVRMAWYPGNYLGDLSAPLRLDLEQFVLERCPLHFIVNVVTTIEGGIAAICAGDPVLAHRLAVATARQVYGVPVPHRYPVVLADARPYDQDLWQLCKGMWCGERITQDGGTLILTGALNGASRRYPALPGYLARDPDQLFAAIQDKAVEDPKSAATAAGIGWMRRRIHIALVTPGLPAAVTRKMGFLHYPSIEHAVGHSLGLLPPGQRAGALAYLPEAGVTLPELP